MYRAEERREDGWLCKYVVEYLTLKISSGRWPFWPGSQEKTYSCAKCEFAHARLNEYGPFLSDILAHHCKKNSIFLTFNSISETLSELPLFNFLCSFKG